jgi:citrate synthase
MSEVKSGVEGVVAFATEIAEPDREGGAMSYRGVDIEELVGRVPFEHVRGLLVDGTLEPGLPPAEPHPLAVRSGDPRVDVQAAPAMLDDVEREGDAERYVRALLDRGDRLMGFGHRARRSRWRGFSRDRRAEDSRARVLRRMSSEIGSHRFEVAEALEQAALADLKARKPGRVLATNVEYWSAVVLDHADVPAELFTSLFTRARTAGWLAHILEQKREARLIRPTANYVGPPSRPLPA